jgi:hypothetical protein
MIWEVLARGRWNLILAVFGAIALPAMVLMALERDGALDPHDPSILQMHMIMALVGMLFSGAAILQSQGKVSRLYAHPLATSEIVTWRLLPAMVIIVLQMVLGTAVLNAMFNLDWPLWGPALTAAVGFAAIQATLWFTENSSGWLLVANAATAGAIGLWFRSRYGGMFSEPSHYWRLLTPGEVLTMLAIAAASYWVAVKGVARNRCGEPPLSVGIIDRLNRILESYTTFNTPPATAFDSQCRYEWQRKGWLMPAAVIVIIVGGLIGWFFGSREPDDLFLAFLGGGGALWMIGFIGGLVFGNMGRSDADYAMGSFIATRPISDGDFARAILKTAATSVLLAWLIWAISFALVCLGLLATGTFHRTNFGEMNWLLYPMTLLGPWAVTGTFASLGLAGRLKAMVIALSGLSAAFIGGTVISSFLSHELRFLIQRGWVLLVVATILGSAPLLFAAARRKGLISSPVVWASAAAWIVGVAATTLFWPATLPLTFLSFLLLAASLALVFIPFAAAPLAVGINRRR